ncbi:MAG: hypothetical protein V5A63_20005 [Bacteroides sp.]
MTTTVPMATVGAADSEGPERPSVPETSDGVAAATATTDTLTITHTFERLPNRPGDVRVTVEADAPNSVSAITLRPPENASAVEADGYQRTDDGWIWERSAAPETATLTHVVTANRTEGGILEATSTGEWALFNWRDADVRWSYSRAADAPEPTVVEQAEAVGEGVVGPGYAYLGPYETETRAVDGETIRLVVPETADMAASPVAVADALARASDSLRVGARNDRLTVFVAPEPIEAAGRLSRAGVGGRRDMSVGADRRLDTADNAWFHEYVHSRQSYEAGPGVAWFEEATAEYYGAWLAYDGSHVSAATFYDYVRTDREGDAVLRESADGDPATYFKGMHVAAALDAELRDATGGDQTFQSVFRRVNAYNGTVTYETLATLVETVAGESRDGWLATYVGTDALPSVPDYLDERTPTATPAAGGSQQDAGDSSVLAVVLFVAALLVGVGTFLFWRRG